jgi:hypothetical protein
MYLCGEITNILFHNKNKSKNKYCNKMTFLLFILYILAFFISLLWLTKLVTDCVSAIYGENFTKEEAERDGMIRIYMIIAISVLWALIITLS